MECFINEYYDNKKTETLVCFVSYCSNVFENKINYSYDILTNQKIKPNLIKSLLLSLFSENKNNSQLFFNDKCINWNGPISKRKIKNGFSITPILNMNISKKKTLQLNAKQLSLFLFSKTRIKKGHQLKSTCLRNLCVNPLHLKQKDKNKKIFSKREKKI